MFICSHVHSKIAIIYYTVGLSMVTGQVYLWMGGSCHTISLLEISIRLCKYPSERKMILEAPHGILRRVFPWHWLVGDQEVLMAVLMGLTDVPWRMAWLPLLTHCRGSQPPRPVEEPSILRQCRSGHSTRTACLDFTLVEMTEKCDLLPQFFLCLRSREKEGNGGVGEMPRGYASDTQEDANSRSGGSPMAILSRPCCG